MHAFLAALPNQAVLRTRVNNPLGMMKCSAESYLCRALVLHDRNDDPDAKPATVRTPRDWPTTDGEQTCVGQLLTVVLTMRADFRGISAPPRRLDGNWVRRCRLAKSLPEGTLCAPAAPNTSRDAA